MMFSGFETATRVEILLDGKPINDFSPHKRALGMVQVGAFGNRHPAQPSRGQQQPTALTHDLSTTTVHAPVIRRTR